MADSGIGARRDAREGAAVADLNSQLDLSTQLNKAYMSGNGAEVERVMALIAAAQHTAAEQLVPPVVARRAARAA